VVVGATVAVVLVLIGGVTALAASGSGDSGFRMTKVVRTSVGNSMVVVGTVEPVADASASFQVAGQVATVSATVGEPVSAGQTLGTLDTTSLSESVSSAESSVQSAEAKLTEDEDSETTSAAATTTTTTTTPTDGVPQTGAGATSGTVGKDQAALVADQANSSADQQQEAADLAQADSACGISSPTAPTTAHPSPTTTTTTAVPTTTSTTTPPTTNGGGCTTAIEQVATDEQAVATDQQAVATDETALSKALAAEASSSGAGNTSSSTPAASSGSSDGGNDSARSGLTSGSNSDSPTQIASDEAAIDSAQANLVVAQQSLAEGQLTSPINGTIVSVGITVGATVGADSSTAVIVIIGTKSFEATATLTSAQVPSVKVGASTAVSVDGTTGTITGLVSQVGPVQSSVSGYSYPVVVALPASANDLFSGSSANISIVTADTHDVLAVPTSAVTTAGTRSYVEVLSGGSPVDKTIKVGVVGSIYTQVVSGLKLGESVVLADYAEPVPASNTATVGGFGGGGGFGGAGGFGGGAGGGFTSRSAGLGATSIGG
jgi:multidrug efflux pump subunit AcrA (membrane-fusion protein)